MKSSATAPRRRSSPTSGGRAASKNAVSKSRAARTPDSNPLIEEGAAIAKAALQNSRFSALAGFAPSMVVAVGRYARRKPVKAAGLALGLGGLLYLSRALWSEAPIAGEASRPRRKAARVSEPSAEAAA